MPQIASLGLLLTIFAGFGQVLCESGSTARNVIGDIREKFTTTGGTAVQGHLFRQCANEAAAVEGSLYSIDVTESKGFVRAVLKEDQDVAWTDTGLEADQGVVQCAIKALEVGAEMYKYDGLCWAHLQDVSEDLLTTDCGAGDVVYVRKRCGPSEFECNDGMCLADTSRCDDAEDCAEGEDELECYNIFRGETIPYGEYSGCFYSSPKGMTFGETSDRLVEELLPSNITCCPFLSDGVCVYVDGIATQDINFCEAVARCEAFGLSLISIEHLAVKEIFAPILSLFDDGVVSQTIPLNYVRDDNGVWKWMPSELTEPQLTFFTEPTADQNCVLGSFSAPTNLPVNCEDAVGHNTICVQADSQLPPCA